METTRKHQITAETLLSFAIVDVNCVKQQLEEGIYLTAKRRSENQLLINPKKTKYRLIGRRQNLQQLPVNMSVNFLNETISPVPFGIDLGMTLDSLLTYDQNISSLVSTYMNTLCELNRLKNVSIKKFYP